MKRSIVRKIAALSLAVLMGTAGFAQVFHDESAALGFCHGICRCARCGWARVNTPCFDWLTYCTGYSIVRNCSSYCGAQ